jgi:ABC-2 type transport system permease protein
LLGKEFAAIYYSSVAYVVAAVFMLLMSYTFCAQLFHMRSASLAGTLIQAATLLLLTVPFLTMRQFSEERRSGTLELLLSSRADGLAIVMAKFLATFSMLTFLVVMVLAFPLTLSFISAPDWGPIVSGLVGLLLLGGALSAIGLAFQCLLQINSLLPCSRSVFFYYYGCRKLWGCFSAIHLMTSPWRFHWTPASPRSSPAQYIYPILASFLA